MITEDKVTELFCIADDFCKFFDAMMEKYTIKEAKKRNYHRDSTLSKSEVMLIKILFPKNRFSMELYYDGECFIYTDGQSKFIIHPNYKIKISRELVAKVNFITATRRTDKMEFNGRRYIKIENDPIME